MAAEEIARLLDFGDPLRPQSAFDIALCCTVCKAPVYRLCCTKCGFEMREHDGIIDALAPDRAQYYARFLTDYERIRLAEGRGSEDASFYLALPYRDTTGRNSQQWAIRARSYDYLIRHLLVNLPARGRVLDLGAGNCWLSYRLSRMGFRPVAVDLLTNRKDGLGAAFHLREHLPTEIPCFQAELGCLPFRDNQFDTVIFNASFHYSENYEETLREALRCVKAGGKIIISDSPWYRRTESGQQMVAERHAFFHQRYGTASDSIRSLEFLTDDRLHALETALSIEWIVYRPWYGWRWATRPLVARAYGHREPSRFRIYVATKNA